MKIKLSFVGLYSLVATLPCFVGCQGVTPVERDSSIYVSIIPIRTIVERIVEDDFPIEVVVPSGASVETYEATPKQFIALNKAQFIFSTGLLNFEETIINRVQKGAKVVNLSRGIELISGSCSHHHHEGHSHGVDPHIWTSPRELRVMARGCFEAIKEGYPDSLKYERNYLALDKELADLDAECAEALSGSGVSSIFIYHPAYTYYARAYGVEQVAIENDGKEPSAKHLAEIIRRGRKEGVKSVFYQVQYPRSSVEIVAQDIGAESVEVDPLAADVIGQIKSVTYILTE